MPLAATPRAVDPSAEDQFRTFGETTAVRLRWISIAVIPVLVALSGEPILHPWFEATLVLAAIYNGRVSLGAKTFPGGYSFATSVVDSLLLLLICLQTGGTASVVTLYPYIALIATCSRLSAPAASAVGVLHALELGLLAWLDGLPFLSGWYPVRALYLFLVIAFVFPLVREARARLGEALQGQRTQRELLHRLLTTNERERQRIANELHDRGGGALFALLHGLRRLRSLTTEPTPRRDPEGTETQIDELIRTTETTVQDLRGFLADLRPQLLYDLGLNEALRELLTRERTLVGNDVTFDASPGDEPDAERSVALYRVAQEALTNVRRHAHATQTAVRFTDDGDAWHLEIHDDGRGIARPRRGLGLRTMHERMEAFGGSVEVESSPGRGTRIHATMPKPPATTASPPPPPLG